MAVQWSDAVDDAIRGDLVAAAAYITRAGGAVVTSVAPCGLDRRPEGILGFTTSLGFGRKLEHIIREPRVALAFHTRRHGFCDRPLFVLAQGTASVDLKPSRQRLDAFVPQAERYLGKTKHGPLWDRVLREYYWERVFVDISVERLVTWPDLEARGQPEVTGAVPFESPAPQAIPPTGTEPRLEVGKAAGQVMKLPHQVIAFRGADGFPIVVPVRVTGHDGAGLSLEAAGGLLPGGGRRAGLLAHEFGPRLNGISSRVLTGWLSVTDDGAATYAPFTSKGLAAPPLKDLALLANGVFAKVGYRQAVRRGLPAHLERLAMERPVEPEAPAPAER